MNKEYYGILYTGNKTSYVSGLLIDQGDYSFSPNEQDRLTLTETEAATLLQYYYSFSKEDIRIIDNQHNEYILERTYNQELDEYQSTGKLIKAH